MLPNTEPLSAQLGQEAGDLLTGDIGLIVLRALLENGVGYVISSWRDRPTPLDAAIDQARVSVLTRRGILLRRLRSLSTLESLISAPAPLEENLVPRGAVIFAGRRGLRPSLEAFVQTPVNGGVIGFCFDEEAALISDGIVIDPVVNARGLVEAVDFAYTASVRSQRPVLILLREEMLGIRGTIRCRREVTNVEAAALDAASPREQTPIQAALSSRIIRIIDPSGSAAEGASMSGRSVIIAPGAQEITVRRALTLIAEQHPALSRSVNSLVLISRLSPRLSLAGSEVESLIKAAESTLELVRVDNGEALVMRIAQWLMTNGSLSESLSEAKSALQEFIDQRKDEETKAAQLNDRIPRRDEQLHRFVTPSIAAGLALAQDVIGVPGRVDAEHSTFLTETGVPLTVVHSEAFKVQGKECQAPSSAHGVFVVVGSIAGVTEVAGSLGASVELVEGSSPRSIGVAVAAACQSVRSAPHVIMVNEAARSQIVSTSQYGVDPDLLGSDRISTSALADNSVAVVELGDELAPGPAQIPIGGGSVDAGLFETQQLSAATWQLDVTSRAGQSRFRDFMWDLRRRLIRTFAGIDL